ncbi:hypothetical protein C8J56DRAFT_901331 [Mycena floridula]|nr:hypothetical protein C8J56DRAFT_901331 [Mycena floridula]
MTDTTMLDTAANNADAASANIAAFIAAQSRLPADSLHVLLSLHAAIVCILVANNIAIPAVPAASTPASTTIEMNPVFDPPPHPDVLDQHFATAPDKEYSVVIKGRYCGIFGSSLVADSYSRHSRRSTLLSQNIVLAGTLKLWKRLHAKDSQKLTIVCSTSRLLFLFLLFVPMVSVDENTVTKPLTKDQKHYARYGYSLYALSSVRLDLCAGRHAEARRAASLKYYHERRKFVLQERRAAERNRKLLAVTPPEAPSPLPPSTPPSIHSDDEDEESQDILLAKPLLLLVEDIRRWYAFWGGEMVWEIVVERIHDGKSPLGSGRRSELINEIDHHIALGKALQRRWEAIGTGPLPSGQEAMRLFMKDWSWAEKSISHGLSVFQGFV